MTRAGFVLALILGAATAMAAGDEKKVTMKCRGLIGTKFCCVAENVATFEPRWQLYSKTNPDDARGPSACFTAPATWSIVEMRVTDATDTTTVVRGFVQYDDEKKLVVFAPYQETR